MLALSGIAIAIRRWLTGVVFVESIIRYMEEEREMGY